MTTAIWKKVPREYRPARILADGHYSRKKPGTRSFTPPARALVLMTEVEDAVWVTTAPRADMMHNPHAGSWENNLFRRMPKCQFLASELILSALAVTRHEFGEPSHYGLVTYINRTAVRPTMVRGEKVWGWCYRKAGFHDLGDTSARGYLILGISLQEMPDPIAPIEIEERA